MRLKQTSKRPVFTTTTTPVKTGIQQKRTIYAPEKIKGLYEGLTSKAQEVSPVIGAIELETGAIQKRYETESEAFGPQLVQELFYKQGPQFRPTASKSKAAYSLSPEIIGLVIGALESGRLQEQKVRDYIINQWLDEYRRITDEKRPFPRGKIEKLLTLIENEYKNDKDSCRRILLGFLYAKAIPDNDHDMIHYLAGLSEFMQVFVETHEPVAQAVQHYTEQKKGLEKTEPTFFDRLKSFVKKYIIRESATYTQKDYDVVRHAWEVTPRKEVLQKAATTHFELVVSAMLNEKRSTSLYAPKVIQSSYGYKDKSPAPNCVETALQDLLNIMLYNPSSQSFDLTFLPSNFSLNNDFKQFYTTYSSASKINTRECGQAFMNLVSGVEGVGYVRGDYELNAAMSVKNFVTLANHFFGIKAHNLGELGTMLSDERRTITFTGPIVIVTGNNSFSKITMNINNRKTGQRLQADFCFHPGHGWLEVPQRDKQGAQQKSLFTPEELAHNYRINAEAQALFRIQPNLSALFSTYPQYQPSISLFYAFPTETDSQRFDVIKKIMSMNNINQEALDYALSLYQQMPLNWQGGPVATAMINGGIILGLWRTDTRLKNLVVRYWSTALDIALTELSDEKTVDFIKDLYRELPDNVSKQTLINVVLAKTVFRNLRNDSFRIKLYEQLTDFIKELYTQFSDDLLKQQFIQDILKMTINIPLFNTNFVLTLYECITDVSYKKKFFADLLYMILTEPTPRIDWPRAPSGYFADSRAARDRYSQEHEAKRKLLEYYQQIRKNIDLIFIAKKCIADGADITGNATIKPIDTTSTTPLYCAIRLNNAALIELLISSGVSVDTPFKYLRYEDITPLGLALSENNVKMVEFLLKHGANPNVAYLYNSKLTYPIFEFSINFLRENILKLLIQYGADVNILNGKQETPLDAFDRAGKNRWGGSLEQQRKILVDAGAKTSTQIIKEQLQQEIVNDAQERLARE